MNVDSRDLSQYRPAPRVGDELAARVLRRVATHEWLLECSDLPPGWSATPKSKAEKQYEPGDEGTFWVVSTPWKAAIFSDSDFGRRPLSDRMRPRYIQALRAGLTVLDSPSTASEIPADHLSELTGIFNRCFRKDQHDWLTLYKLLGRPPMREVRKIADILKSLSQSVRRAEPEVIEAMSLELCSLADRQRLQSALDAIISQIPRLSHSGQSRLISERATPDNIENHASDDPYIISVTARDKMRWASNTHAATLSSLTMHLEGYGYVVEESLLVDAYCYLKSGAAIFEVKSITPQNEREQCRHALSQLYEYRYLHDLPAASLWIVLSSRPKAAWLIEYLRRDRGVRLLWLEDGLLGGPDLNALV